MDLRYSLIEETNKLNMLKDREHALITLEGRKLSTIYKEELDIEYNKKVEKFKMPSFMMLTVSIIMFILELIKSSQTHKDIIEVFSFISLLFKEIVTVIVSAYTNVKDISDNFFIHYILSLLAGTIVAFIFILLFYLFLGIIFHDCYIKYFGDDLSIAVAVISGIILVTLADTISQYININIFVIFMIIHFIYILLRLFFTNPKPNNDFISSWDSIKNIFKRTNKHI